MQKAGEWINKLSEETIMTDKIEIRKAKTGYYWRIVAPNGRILVTSEVYTTHASCIKTVRNFRKRHNNFEICGLLFS